MKILLIDNYDSFVYNLYQYFDEAGCDVIVERNDKVDLDKVDSYDALILSPGPGIPKDAGLLKEIITRFKTKPMLGICLGMQAIGEVFDGQLDLLEKPLHGFSTEIEHYNNSIFNEVPKLYTVGRYHSWVVNENSLNGQFEILSRASISISVSFMTLNSLSRTLLTAFSFSSSLIDSIFNNLSACAS